MTEVVVDASVLIDALTAPTGDAADRLAAAFEDSPIGPTPTTRG